MEKTGKRKEKLFFCFRVLLWIAALIVLFSTAANLRVFAAESEESEKEEEEEEFFVINEKEQELVMYDGEETDVIVPEGIIRIGMDAFEKNEYLRSVTLPEGVTVIGEGAFLGCTSLKVIVFPAFMEAIGCAAFQECGNLETVTCSASLKQTELIEKSLLLSTSTKAIGDRAFLQCEKLREVAIPEGIQVIREDTFSDCSNLEYVKLPSTLQKNSLCV